MLARNSDDKNENCMLYDQLFILEYIGESVKINEFYIKDLALGKSCWQFLVVFNIYCHYNHFNHN